MNIRLYADDPKLSSKTAPEIEREQNDADDIPTETDHEQQLENIKRKLKSFKPESKKSWLPSTSISTKVNNDDDDVEFNFEDEKNQERKRKL